jgi:hypothetical protein
LTYIAVVTVKKTGEQASQLSKLSRERSLLLLQTILNCFVMERERNNILFLRRIFVRLQGAVTGA